MCQELYRKRINVSENLAQTLTISELVVRNLQPAFIIIKLNRIMKTLFGLQRPYSYKLKTLSYHFVQEFWPELLLLFLSSNGLETRLAKSLFLPNECRFSFVLRGCCFLWPFCRGKAVPFFHLSKRPRRSLRFPKKIRVAAK